ncbi:MAG: metal ABC transporter permease [Magnetococcales bacterium]|nr:metal ABC transporter permease [Magnetococcales bacterium]MBF0156871.1 metal ABC transporter permease [Magnetococcales bacterium]
MEDFILRAWFAGVGVALIAGPLGCFVVWRRLAYLGETMAHGGLLGLALGFAMGWPPLLCVLGVVLLMALLLARLQRGGSLADDTLLGILAHGSLALGLVILGFMTWLRVDLFAFLFGDILAVSAGDIALIWGVALGLLLILGYFWNPLLSMTLHEELARAEGVPVDRLRLLILILIAVLIAVAMKVVGILLTTALMIIPPATARLFSGSPEQMAVLASLLGVVSVALGLSASGQWDLPAGPAIVLAAAVLFALGFWRRGRTRS